MKLEFFLQKITFQEPRLCCSIYNPSAFQILTIKTVFMPIKCVLSTGNYMCVLDIYTSINNHFIISRVCSRRECSLLSKCVVRTICVPLTQWEGCPRSQWHHTAGGKEDWASPCLLHCVFSEIANASYLVVIYLQWYNKQHQIWHPRYFRSLSKEQELHVSFRANSKPSTVSKCVDQPVSFHSALLIIFFCRKIKSSLS